MNFGFGLFLMTALKGQRNRKTYFAEPSSALIMKPGCGDVATVLMVNFPGFIHSSTVRLAEKHPSVIYLNVE